MAGCFSRCSAYKLDLKLRPNSFYFAAEDML